jgi:hypothetical protein
MAAAITRSTALSASAPVVCLSNSQTSVLIDGEVIDELVAVPGEDRADHARFLISGGIVQPQQQDAGVRLFRAVHHLTEVFLHRHDQPLLPDRSCKNVVIAHARVEVPHRFDIIACTTQPLLHPFSDSDIRENEWHHIHAAATG